MIQRIFNQLSVVIGIIFLVGIYRYLSQTTDIRIGNTITQIGAMPILLSFLFYILSHLLRALRLAVMAGREDISLRSIIRTQFYTNGINLILPFKLGDVYRLYEFHKLIRKYQVSVSVIVTEKFIDFCFLFIGLAMAFYSGEREMLNISFTIGICAMCVALLLFALIALPHNIESFNLFIAKRYSYPFVIRILAFTSKVNSIITNMKMIFREKTSTLFFFTALIWMFEILSFIFLYPFINDMHLMLLLSFLVFLSIFIPSGSLGLGGVQLAFYFISLMRKDFPFMELSLIYQMFIFLPAIMISFLLLLYKKYKEHKEAGRVLYNRTLSNVMQSVMYAVKRKVEKVYLFRGQ